jgi:L-cysteine/cystine lyase
VSELDGLRGEFPVLEHIAYLNAGTDGPIPRRAADAAAAVTAQELAEGRSGPGHLELMFERWSALRVHVAALASRRPEEVALTRSTTDGINLVLHGLALEPGDELLTSDEEHPGLLAPLAAAARRSGAEVRAVPFDRIAEHAGERTRLVACSHVSWVSGRSVDGAALAALDAPVLLDGAQGLGAVPVDLDALGTDFYAASGQKWLCGPDATGYLLVRAERLDTLGVPWPSYLTLAEPGRAAELIPHPDARRLDMGVVGGPAAAWSLAALEVLSGAGWGSVLERGPVLAERLAAALAAGGADVPPRGQTTLVAWADDDPPEAVRRLAAAGFVVRDLRGRGLVRASVGAWSSEAELDELAEFVTAR